MSFGAGLEMKINMKDRICGFEKDAHLSSFLDDRVQRVVIVGGFPFARGRGHHRGLEDSDGLDHASSRKRDLGGVGGSGRVWAAGDRVCLFPGVVTVSFQLFRAEIESRVTCQSTNPRRGLGLDVALGMLQG